MRIRLLAVGIILGTTVAASAYATVGTQQWSTLDLKVSADSPQAVHAAGPLLETPSTLVGRPDEALRARPDPGAEVSLVGSFGKLPKPKPGPTAPVPEPGTISLLAMGLIGAGLGMRRRKTQ